MAIPVSTPEALEVTGLVACRAAGLILSSPLLPSRLLSLRLKLGLTALLALCLLGAPGIRQLADGGPEGGGGGWSWPAALGEVALGCVLGWGCVLVLGAVAAACHLMSQVTGLAFGAASDRVAGPDCPALTRLCGLLTVLVFVALDLHHLLLRVLVESFTSVPPGGLSPSALGTLLGRTALSAAPDLAAAAWSLALPVVAVTWLVSAAQGLLGRMLPATEILVLGLPVRAFVGLAALALVLPAAAGTIRTLLDTAVREGTRLLSGL